MIPVIFAHGSTDFIPDGIYSHPIENGLGRIPECTECIVTQNVNQQFECRFTVPTNAKHYADIIEGNIIACKVPELDNLQAFDIYGHDETINGLMTFYANHISYRLNNVIMKVTNGEIYFGPPNEAMEWLNTKSNHYYSTGYDALEHFNLSSTAALPLTTDFNITVPTPLRKILIESAEWWAKEAQDGVGRIIYPGLIYDNFDVTYVAAAGQDRGINVYYGKNITDYNRNIDYSEVFNACVPYAVNNSGDVWTLYDASSGAQSIVGLPGVDSADWVVQAVDVSKDLSDPDTWPPTASELSALGLKWLQDNAVNIPIQNTEISFEQLWQTQDYATIAALEQVKLYDRITVVYGPGKVKLENVPIVATEYDVLNERYSSMQLGAIQQNYGDTVRGIIEKTLPNGIDGKAIQIQIKGSGGTWETVEAKLNKGIICLND